MEIDVKKLQPIARLSLFNVEIENFLTKHEYEPFLLEEIAKHFSGDPKGHLASEQNNSGVLRSNNGSKSHTKLFDQITTRHKCLMAVEF